MFFKMQLTHLLVTFGCLVGFTIQNSHALTGCSAPVDVSFLIDCSYSIWRPDFETLIKFVQDIVGQFEIGPDKIQVATITFATDTKIQFNFGELTTTEAVVERVRKITQDLGRLTKTQDALKMMRTSLFSSQYTRQGVPKICILLTDGTTEEHEETLRQATEAKEAGIQIMVIGIGNNKNVGDVEQDRGDNTVTHEALREMRTQLFSPSKGSRVNVKHVCIILTDGNATMQDETIEEAHLVFSEDIFVIAIGIGEHLNKADLMSIVSQPTDKNVFFQNTYDKLKSADFQELVSRQACPTERLV